MIQLESDRLSSRDDKVSPLFEKPKSRRGSAWTMIYISLFSSLLAFFLIILVYQEMEFVDEKRIYQRTVNLLTEQAIEYRQQNFLPWLEVENTLSQGIRLRFAADKMIDLQQFDSAQTQITPAFVPYLNRIAQLLDQLLLPPQIPPKWQQTLAAKNKAIRWQVLVAGHTDARPMQPNARFVDNVELSSYRAFAVMRYLQRFSQLPWSMFSIAGYGGFHPAVADANDAQNRRVEIYIQPVIYSLDEAKVLP